MLSGITGLMRIICLNQLILIAPLLKIRGYSGVFRIDFFVMPKSKANKSTTAPVTPAVKTVAVQVAAPTTTKPVNSAKNTPKQTMSLMNPTRFTEAEYKFMVEYFNNLMTCEKPFRLPRFVRSATVPKKNNIDLLLTLPADSVYNAVLIDVSNPRTYLRQFKHFADSKSYPIVAVPVTYNASYGPRVYITPSYVDGSVIRHPLREDSDFCSVDMNGIVARGCSTYIEAHFLNCVLRFVVSAGWINGTMLFNVIAVDTVTQVSTVVNTGLITTNFNDATQSVTINYVPAGNNLVRFYFWIGPNPAATSVPNSFSMIMAQASGSGFHLAAGLRQTVTSLFDAAVGSNMMAHYHGEASEFAVNGSTLWLENTSNVLSKGGKLYCAQVDHDQSYFSMSPEQLYNKLAVQEYSLYEGPLSQGVFRTWTPSTIDLVQFRRVRAPKDGDLLIVVWCSTDFVDGEGNETLPQLTLHSNCVLEYITSDTFDTPFDPLPSADALLGLFYWYYADACTENPSHIKTILSKVKRIISNPQFQAVAKTMVPILMRGLMAL